MRRRRHPILALCAAAALGLGGLLAGCETAPRTGYDPNAVTLESILEGIADIALFVLSIWVGYEYYGGHYSYGGHGHHGYSGHHGGPAPVRTARACLRRSGRKVSLGLPAARSAMPYAL